jgi:hypothetical protein
MAGIVPVVSLPFEWFLAYGHRRLSETTHEHRGWSRWFLGLAIVDTIVASLVIVLVVSGVWSRHTLTERRSQHRPGDALRIGVTAVANPERPDEAQIAWVATDSPAERAGLGWRHSHLARWKTDPQAGSPVRHDSRGDPRGVTHASYQALWRRDRDRGHPRDQGCHP